MKALAVILAMLLVLAHPAGAAAVLGVELAVCGGIGCLIWRASRSHSHPYWRTA
jgi:hypothetical protein